MLSTWQLPQARHTRVSLVLRTHVPCLRNIVEQQRIPTVVRGVAGGAHLEAALFEMLSVVVKNVAVFGAAIC